MKTIFRLLSFMKPFWPQVLLSAILGALTIGASISLMSTSAYLISVAALHPSIAAIDVAIVGVRFFGISRGVFRYLERLVSHSLTFKVLSRLRVWFYQSIEPLAPAGLVSSRSGDLLNRIISDVETLDNFYVRVLAPPLVAVIVILAVAIFMGSFAPILGFVLTIFLILIGVGLTVLSLVLNREPGKILTEERAKLRADLVDLIQGLPDLIVFGQMNQWVERIKLRSKFFGSIQTQMARRNGIQSGLNSLLMGLGIWFLLIISILLVAQGMILGIYLAVILLGSMASFEAVQNLPQAAQLLESNLQSARRLFEISDSQPLVRDPAAPLARPLTAGLSVNDLSFGYENSILLKNINFDLPVGSKTAIVGPSGAGKTTLVNLFMRFWEFSEGSILLDGQDIRRYNSVDVRRMINLVNQATYLFNTSLSENLRMARPNATQEEIEAACRKAELHDFITTLPKGYETIVGERGVQFSGGERQRVSIARAILKDAPLLILDEPTANLDPATEYRLIQTIKQVAQEKSVLWITHRLIGLEDMDQILVMDRGQIVERGTHHELIRQSGLYKKLFDLQVF